MSYSCEPTSYTPPTYPQTMLAPEEDASPPLNRQKRAVGKIAGNSFQKAPGLPSAFSKASNRSDQAAPFGENPRRYRSKHMQRREGKASCSSSDANCSESIYGRQEAKWIEQAETSLIVANELHNHLIKYPDSPHFPAIYTQMVISLSDFAEKCSNLITKDASIHRISQSYKNAFETKINPRLYQSLQSLENWRSCFRNPHSITPSRKTALGAAIEKFSTGQDLMQRDRELLSGIWNEVITLFESLSETEEFAPYKDKIASLKRLMYVPSIELHSFETSAATSSQENTTFESSLSRFLEIAKEVSLISDNPLFNPKEFTSFQKNLLSCIRQINAANSLKTARFNFRQNGKLQTWFAFQMEAYWIQVASEVMTKFVHKVTTRDTPSEISDHNLEWILDSIAAAGNTSSPQKNSNLLKNHWIHLHASLNNPLRREIMNTRHLTREFLDLMDWHTNALTKTFETKPLNCFIIDKKQNKDKNRRKKRGKTPSPCLNSSSRSSSRSSIVFTPGKDIPNPEEETVSFIPLSQGLPHSCSFPAFSESSSESSTPLSQRYLESPADLRTLRSSPSYYPSSEKSGRISTVTFEEPENSPSILKLFKSKKSEESCDSRGFW